MTVWISDRWQHTNVRTAYRDADRLTYGAIVEIDGVAVLVKQLYWRAEANHLVVFAPWPTGGSLTPSVHKLAELVRAGLLQERALRHGNATVNRHVWVGDPIAALKLLIPEPATSLWHLPDGNNNFRLPGSEDHQAPPVNDPRSPGRQAAGAEREDT
ncbi:hypothetical protein [Nocardia africana]|uniref:hypothetical protein n=1 Tax=Nocardia africana TaxID=134964 RepID=UPI000FE1A8CB|nr:hypothetical protein [Nocardia africana]MCC3317947.1 hypothetical protein [Nocardia africana]